MNRREALQAIVCRLGLICVGMLLCLAGCGEAPSASGDAPSTPAATPSGPAIELLFVYGSEKQNWIDAVTPDFNAKQFKTSKGNVIVVTPVAMGSGESRDDILAGRVRAHVWSPASGIFVRLANAEAMAKGGKPLLDNPKELCLSPIVIAMWKPMAEKLGWPAKPIGWSDVLELARDPNGGWPARGAPQFGRFKFGHTHPEYSNSGLSSLLIELFAATGKQRDLTLDDLKKPEVVKYIGDIERGVVHYGRSTGFYGKRLVEDGPGYLSAAVVYENMVIESYEKSLDPPLVAIYPKEGTVWSDHPAGVVQRDWVDDEHREAGEAYLKFLREPAQQARALQFGFRPAEGAIGAPIDAAHGVDPDQPKTILDLPSAEVINAAIELWREQKKPSTVALVFDKSGSMKEQNKIGAAKKGAIELINMLSPNDRLLFVPFSSDVQVIDLGPMKDNRQEAIDAVNALQADGGTALYEAIDAARAALAPIDARERITAVVALTDGAANGKKVTLDKLLDNIRGEVEVGGARVFTIGYGDQAEMDQLAKIAKAARGDAKKSDAKNVIAVFRDIATFF